MVASHTHTHRQASTHTHTHARKHTHTQASKHAHTNKHLWVVGVELPNLKVTLRHDGWEEDVVVVLPKMERFEGWIGLELLIEYLAATAA